MLIVVLGIFISAFLLYVGTRFWKNKTIGTTIAYVPYSGVWPHTYRYSVIDGKMSSRDLKERYRAARGWLGTSFYLSPKQSQALGLVLLSASAITFVVFVILEIVKILNSAF